MDINQTAFGDAFAALCYHHKAVGSSSRRKSDFREGYGRFNTVSAQEVVPE